MSIQCVRGNLAMYKHDQFRGKYQSSIKRYGPMELHITNEENAMQQGETSWILCYRYTLTI